MFPFQPLDTKVDSIRLLIVLPASASSDGEVHCELEHRTFASKPNYEALSYVWGDGLANKKINVNGEVVFVKGNLYNALRNFRRRSKRTLWVDALCVNLSDPQERNDQVSMMSYIYSRADKVLAWLGQSRQNFTKFELQAMKSPQSRWNMVWSDANCTAVAQSSFWSRRWVIQELILAKEVHFCLGIGYFTMDSYINLFSGSEFESLRQRLELIEAQRKYKGSDMQRLDVLLESFMESECHETRDRIFSFMGIADDIAQDMIEIDYETGFWDLYTALIEYYQASSPQPRRAYCFARDFDFGPWTDANRLAEFSEEIERSVRLVSFSHLIQKALKGLVDGSRNVTESRTDLDSIVVRGAFAGKILRLGPTYQNLISSWESNKQWRAVLEDEYKGQPKLVDLRKASADYSRAILSWDDNHVQAIRGIKTGTSYAYQNSSNDEDIELDGVEENNKTSEPRVFLATQGLMGFVPPESREGDLIYSFWECNVGFVVRKVAEDRWMIVGRADLSNETLPGVLDKSYFTKAFNYGTAKESYSWRKGSKPYNEARREAFENMLNFKLDIGTLQHLTA